ncbi:MAG: glycosyltransferase [Ignavibacteriaceae bacterium]|nr:glycosyltransferase [Ignavibacteriaceae bacterium]
MKQQNPVPENSPSEVKQETELKPEIPVQEIKSNDNSQKVVSEQIVKTEDPVKFEAKIPAQKPAEKYQETIIPVQKNEPKAEQEKQPDVSKTGSQNRDIRNQRNKKPDNFNDNRRNNRSSFSNQGNQQSQENRGAQSNKQSGYQPGVSQQANYQINQGNRNPRREPDNRVDQKQRDKDVDNKEKPVRVNFKKVSIVIPLLNEEEALIPLANEIRKAFQAIPVPVEVVFIDDGSTDKSLKIIKDICRNDQRFKFLSFQRNYGKSAALNVGFKNVTGDVVITMDADLQDNPHEIPGLVKKLAEGYDLVSGWKKKRHDPFIKKHTSKLFNFVTGLLSGIKLHDFNCGLKAYRRNVVENLNIYGEMHRYIPILAHWKGFKVTEIPVKHQPRRFGVTKFGASRFYKGLVDLVTVMFITRYTKRPMHLFGLLGFLSFSAGLGINGYLSYIKFIEGLPLTERPLLFLGMLLMILGVQLFSTGLLGELMVHNFQNDKEYCIRESSLKQGSQGS